MFIKSWYNEWNIEEEDQGVIVSRNIDVILDTFNVLQTIPVSVAEQVKLIQQTTQSRDFSRVFFEDEKHNIAMYHLLWLGMVHRANHNQDLVVLFPIQLALAANDDSWNELQHYLIEGERLQIQAHPIQLPQMTLEEVKQDLSSFLQTLAV